MAEGGGPKLPVLGGILAELAGGGGPPSLDEARATLGGPSRGTLRVGEIVAIDGARVGAVVHGSEEGLDVWIGGGRIQRVDPSRALPTDAAEADLRAAAADAEVFATLSEGAAVVYQARDGATGEGRLLEKLRYGALVGLDDGRVLAVSFRRVGPVASERA